MDTLFVGSSPLFHLIITLLVFPFLVYLSIIIPYGLGKVLAGLLTAGKSFNSSYQVCTFIGGMGFSALAALVLGASLLQLFTISGAEWWYQHLFSIGATGNTMGIICSFLAGFFKGEVA